MKILLIWEEVPEATRLFMLDADESDVAVLSAANGWNINEVGAPEDAEVALNKIVLALAKESDRLHYVDNGLDFEGWFGIWNTREVFPEKYDILLVEGIEGVVKCGFYQ